MVTAEYTLETGERSRGRVILGQETILEALGDHIAFLDLVPGVDGKGERDGIRIGKIDVEVRPATGAEVRDLVGPDEVEQEDYCTCEREDYTCDRCGLFEKDVVVADQTWMHEWPTEDGTYEDGFLCPACCEKIPAEMWDDYYVSQGWEPESE